MIQSIKLLMIFLVATTIHFSCDSNQEQAEKQPSVSKQMPSQAPSPTAKAISQNKNVERAYNEALYIQLAKEQFGIEIEKIFFGHNKTGLTAVIVNIPEKIGEKEIEQLQENLNKVFQEYKSADLYTIVNYKEKPYALVMARTHSYDKEKRWISIYKYEFAYRKAKEAADRFVSKYTTFKALENHEIVSIHYGLEWIGLPLDKSEFPSALVCFTKDQKGNYFRFKVYAERIGTLWAYRFNEEKNRYYSTGQREDHQVAITLPNGDMVNVSLYYFEEDDERYGSYFLKII